MFIGDQRTATTFITFYTRVYCMQFPSRQQQHLLGSKR